MKILGWLLGITTVVAALPAQAGIVSVSNVNVIAPPLSVQKNALVGTPASLIVERLNHTTTTDLTADITSDGVYAGDPGDVLFSSGQAVDSYYVHFDIESTAFHTTSGSITFDQPILAVIGEDDHLSNSHSELGAAGTTYWTGVNSLHGIWDSNPQDSVTVNGSTINFSISVGSAIDSFRILTAPIPEPRSMALASLATLGLVGSRRRRV